MADISILQKLFLDTVEASENRHSKTWTVGGSIVEHHVEPFSDKFVFLWKDPRPLHNLSEKTIVRLFYTYRVLVDYKIISCPKTNVGS